MSSNRDKSIDIMRGIGILAVLSGHCVIPDLMHRFIYMWHMPLFFLVSGFFFSRKDLSKMLYGLYRNLILPYITVCGIVIFLTTDKPEVMRYVYGVVGMSFMHVDKGGFLYNCPGPLWFIPALFWSRVIYSIVDKYLVRHELLVGG